jgi:hypothetical protein
MAVIYDMAVIYMDGFDYFLYFIWHLMELTLPYG